MLAGCLGRVKVKWCNALEVNHMARRDGGYWATTTVRALSSVLGRG